jgi:hypothetical protein
MSKFYCDNCGVATMEPYTATATGFGYKRVFCSEECEEEYDSNSDSSPGNLPNVGMGISGSERF